MVEHFWSTSTWKIETGRQFKVTFSYIARLRLRQDDLKTYLKKKNKRNIVMFEILTN